MGGISNKPLRVAVVIHYFPKLSESFILNQIVSLIEQGIEVRIFAARPPDKGEPANELFAVHRLQEFISYEPRQMRSAWLRKAKHLFLFMFLLFRSPRTFLRLVHFDGVFFNRVYLYAIWPLLRHPSGFDVVHAHFGPAGVKVCNIQRLGFLNAPLICSFHGYDVDRNDFRNNPSYYRELFHKAALITGNSEFTATNIKRLGCAAEKLRVLPESLFTDYFKINGDTRPQEQIVTILTVARLVEFKGVEYSIRSIGELVRRGTTRIKYVVIGDGPLRDSLLRLAREAGILDYVVFAGAQTQDYIIRAMHKSDIFLLSGVASSDGREENQGLVLQEAQAMELPVVASDIGGIKEGVLDNETGFLVAPKDIKGLADQLERLINSKDLRKKFGTAGRKFVRDHFDSRILGERLVGLYREVAQ